ncbi:MAG: hypothetical protein R3D59_00995 [Paracoccaceae bacterium]
MSRLQDLARRAGEIEAELEAEIARRRDALGGRLVRGRIVFEAEVRTGTGPRARTCSTTSAPSGCATWRPRR